MKLKTLWIAGCMLLGVIANAQASIITNASSISSASVVDFSQFGSFYTFSAGPTEVGGLVGESITFTSTTSLSVIGLGGYGLAANGSWNPTKTHAGLNTGFGSMTFTLNDRLVSAIGGFVNYAPGNGSPILIEALDSFGSVLESYDLETIAPISTPSATNGGEFRGISRTTTDIAAFRLTNAYIVLDDLKIGSSISSVPEPTSLAIWGIGALGGIFLTARKRRAVK